MDTRELRVQMKRAAEDVSDGVERFRSVCIDLLNEIDRLEDEIETLKEQIENLKADACQREQP